MPRKTKRTRYIDQAATLARLLHQHADEAAFIAKVYDRGLRDADTNDVAGNIIDVIRDVEQALDYIRRTTQLIDKE